MHFHSDVRLLQRLLLVLGRVIREGFVDGVLEHLCQHPLLPSTRRPTTWTTDGDAALFTPPPVRHLLDERVRNYDLVDEDLAMSTPSPFTCTVVAELPRCDWCSNTARIDGWAEEESRGRTAGNLCLECFSMMSDPLLGPGLGAYLFQPDEVPDLVRRVCNMLCVDQDREPVFPELDEDVTSSDQDTLQTLQQGLHSIRTNLASQLQNMNRELESIVATFVVDAAGRFAITADQNHRYVVAVRHARSIKGLLDDVAGLIDGPDD